jgi:hypothetical protein
MFVGEHFTLVTSVELDERLRTPDDKDDDGFAIRLAAVWLGEMYGWDMLAASNEAGIIDRHDDDEQDPEDG